MESVDSVSPSGPSGPFLRRYEVLLEMADLLVHSGDLQQLLRSLGARLKDVVAFDRVGFSFYDESRHVMSLNIWDGAGQPPLPLELPVDKSIAGWVWQHQQRVMCPDTSQEGDLPARFPATIAIMRQRNMRALCILPLTCGTHRIGALSFGNTQPGAYDGEDLDFLQRVCTLVALAVENHLNRQALTEEKDRVEALYQQVTELKDKLAEEKIYLEDEIRTELNFEQIIGESPALKQTLAGARTVAPSDATALILGETGTGKELIARAIHDMSPRREKNFIKVNCAAIPTGLLESELFGHEKGAFTGALTKKIGRLELADAGTLFLDEVGDIALELQPKLLRVLQDHEFERLGSARTLKVDIRIIAATNRDLKHSVDTREFRRDLFYRLNVFPILVPPLRDRRKDIPLLVRYFVQRFARRMNKPIDSIPAEAMNALINWDWPGNVRELENFVERSVILTRGRSLEVPVAELAPPSGPAEKRDITLVAAEREHILKVLREAGGVISGSHGAAARLGLKRTTLQSKMQKLGIHRQDYEN